MFLLIEQKDLNRLYIGDEKVDNYKLCYIEEIPETYTDYTPESKKIMESDAYKKWEQEYKEFRDKQLAETGWSTYNWNECPWYNDIQMKEYPNPEREFGTHYAYFTPIELSEQWGDDWNDIPYESNAGIPYDEVTEETKEVDGVKVATKCREYTIIKVPFTSKDEYVYPSSYGYNSPFCIKDINNKAVAWIYNGKDAIHAGINPYDFIEKLKTF